MKVRLPKYTRFWSAIPFTDALIARPLGMVHRHWFRTDFEHPDVDRCAFRDCGRRGVEHLRWVGEWMWTRRRRWAAMYGRIRRNFT